MTGKGQGDRGGTLRGLGGIAPGDAPVEPAGDEIRRLLGSVVDGKYEVTKILGRGGMGAVFEARHAKIGRVVALKVLFPEGARKPETVERFRREAQAAGTIGHEGIAQVYDFGITESGDPFLVMERVEGESLEQVVAREAPLDHDRAVRIAVQVLDALGAAHERGIVHRDIKPGNVMVGPGPDGAERAKLLDFGISKFRHVGPEDQGLTRTGAVLGTPLYMAPEQACGEPDIDHRVDLYAVGAMLYVMLTGSWPYEASNYNALIAKILTESPPPIRSLAADLDPRVALIVEKAMARSREDRFTTAREFAAALEGRASVVPASPPKKRGLGRVAAAGTVAAALLLAGLGATFLYRRGGARAEEDAGHRGVVAAVADAGMHDGRRTGPESDRAGDGGVDAPALAGRLLRVRIRTSPPDARVLMNGTEVSNPVDEEIPSIAGERVQIRVEAPGYVPATRSYPRDGSEPVDDRIALTKSRSKGQPVPAAKGPDWRLGRE